MSAAEKRLRHVEKHVLSEFNKEMNSLSVFNILNGKGSYSGSLAGLESYAHASAIYSWFYDRDIDAVRNWFFTVASIQIAMTKGLLQVQRRHTLSLDSALTVVFVNHDPITR